LPLLHLDHIYFDRKLELKKLRLHNSRTALLASDHLPRVGEFAKPTVDESTFERSRLLSLADNVLLPATV